MSILALGLLMTTTCMYVHPFSLIMVYTALLFSIYYAKFHKNDKMVCPDGKVEFVISVEGQSLQVKG
jgi:hypothetical protein